MKGRIIIVDDELEMRSLLIDYLGKGGYEVHAFPDPIEAIRNLSPGGRFASTENSGDIDLVISDINMPGMNGLDFTSSLRALRPEIPIILMTAYGSLETAVEGMRRGAFHYVVKPFKLTEMLINVERALDYRQLQLDNTTLRQELRRPWSMGGMIGKSPALKAVFDLVQRVAPATANVLITGESGTGKELVARAIHYGGPRSTHPFVAINCSALPENLLESELFGHAKGSFTGAIQRKRGLFEEADGGTLFLDEIGDMNVLLQAKLLRVLQEKKVRPVGENLDRTVDVRIIAATHKDLRAAMKEGRFRDDLYYRLSVVPIVIPPLRHRREDIPLLAGYFLKKYAATNNTPIKGFSKRALAKLMSLYWEGNVRELENVVERAVVLSTGPLIDEADLPSQEAANPEEFFGNATGGSPTLEELEKRYIRLTLERTGNRKDQAAQILGISRRTLYRKETEFGFVSGGEVEEPEGATPEAPPPENV